MAKREKLSQIDIEKICLKRILTFQEAAIFLDVSPAYLYRLTHERKVPFSKPNNGKLYFSREALEAWMMQNAQMTEQEMDIKAATFSRTI
jgi:excisionase family DNA binding protein